jgi:pyruvate kinase
VPIIALTDSERTYRQLALVWGVQPLLLPPAATYEEMFEHGRDVVRELGLVEKGDRVLVTAGVPFDVPRTTNLLRVEVV